MAALAGGDVSTKGLSKFSLNVVRSDYGYLQTSFQPHLDDTVVRLSRTPVILPFGSVVLLLDYVQRSGGITNPPAPVP